MARILITGSNDGLGRDAARRLIDDGHHVVGHARNSEKAERLRRELPGLDHVLVADLTSAGQVRQLAETANVIVSSTRSSRTRASAVTNRGALTRRTAWPHVLAVNVSRHIC